MFCFHRLAKHLVIHPCRVEDVEALVVRPGVSSLRGLTLLGKIQDRGAALLAGAPGTDGLEMLNVLDNGIGVEGVQALAQERLKKEKVKAALESVGR